MNINFDQRFVHLFVADISHIPSAKLEDGDIHAFLMKMENLSNIQNVKLQNVLDQLISFVKSCDHSLQSRRNGHAVDLSQHCEYDTSLIRELNSINKELESQEIHIGSPNSGNKQLDHCAQSDSQFSQSGEEDVYSLVGKRRKRKAEKV